MELSIPLIALGSLYVINNQKKNQKCKKPEGFSNYGKAELLPNTDVQNRNYPSEVPIVSPDMDLTSKLSTTNRYDGKGVYTDKYFNPELTSGYEASVGAGSNFYSLTGEKVGKDYFQHNNMVPYFGSNVRSRQIEANKNESVLDNMNGSGSQSFSKVEQAPLFAPSENYQWAHGTPNQTDFVQSRMNVGMKMSNVKPFAEQHVAPGLGLGYTTEGAGGFNSGMAMREQWLPKTADEMRVANKPKAGGLSQLGYEGPAGSFVTKQGFIGKMEKNRPERAFEMGDDRRFTTTGIVKGPTLHAVPVERYVSRPETTTSYVGVAGHANEATYMPGEYMPSHNQDLGAVPVSAANAVGRGYANDAEYGAKSTKAYNNNRHANHQESYFGAIGGAFGAVIAPVMDVLRPSRKENTVGTLRPYQNAKSSVAQSYLFNPNDRPAPTNRQMSENSKMHMLVNANQRGGAYEVAEHQPIVNERLTTSVSYTGVASAGERGREMKSYESAYNQRNNDIKSSTIDGRLVPGKMGLLNGDINMRQNDRDRNLKMNRAVAPTMPYQSPDMANMGSLQGTNSMLRTNTIQLDRSNPEILNQLHGNPYAKSVIGGL